MIVARVSNLYYVLDADKHTVNFAKQGAALAAKEDWGDTMPAIIADTVDEAAERLAFRLREHLKCMPVWKVTGSEAFNFGVEYSTIEDGAFYTSFSQSSYTVWNVLSGKKVG